jgi:hypothetical protein
LAQKFAENSESLNSNGWLAYDGIKAAKSLAAPDIQLVKKPEMIDNLAAQFPISLLCDLLDVARVENSL